MWNKKIIASIITLILIVIFLFGSSIPILAHETLLNVCYDWCVVDSNNSDGMDEMWYIAERQTSSWHLSHETKTIKYYFKEEGSNGCTWTTGGISEAEAEEIKTAFANSMKKWNNVYFYSYNSDGTVTKNKVINVVEGTAETANLNIYPGIGYESFASAIYEGDYQTAVGTHSHFSKWQMTVYINKFHSSTSSELAVLKERVGAHELGHVLGLFDIDRGVNCGSSNILYHHEELLMGYGESVESRSVNITYKDIAGVAITRGFHTDNDHKWLNMGQQSDGTYKLVCSICNGVKTVSASELNEYSCSTYGACEGDHGNLLYGNMMAVASYGDQDYYKCRYCRYVAPFSAIVDQNYEKTPFSNDLHKCENDIPGLRYTFYEEHTFVNNVCTECGFIHTHTYDNCVYLNSSSHTSVCDCGAVGGISAHYIYGPEQVSNDYAPCAGCGYILDLKNGIYESIMSITQVSINGSYIRSDGIVVLVDEDIEAYLAGTLQFYHPDDVPVTQ